MRDDPLGRQSPRSNRRAATSPPNATCEREDRLQVHRLPQRPRLDVLGFEREPDRFAVGPEGLRVDDDAREPRVRRPVRRLGHERDPGHAVEQLAVTVADPPPRGDASVERLELRPSQRGEEVAHPVVEADLDVLVVRRRLAGLGRELARMLDPVAVPRDEHPTAARRDDLVAVEGERGQRALAPGRRSAVRRAERLGRVLDQHGLVAGADVPQRVVVAALAVQVDGDHGADRGTGAAPLRERAVEQAGVDRPGLVTVDEDRRGARVHDRVRARGEGEVRAGDLVARADSEHDEREVERGSPARQRDRMLDAGDVPELRLERVDLRPERRDPVRCDRLGDELGLPAGEVGRERGRRAPSRRA